MTASSLPIEGYIPGTDTRVNLLGITDTPTLDRIEKRLFTQAMYEFADVPSPSTFTGEFLREIHRRAFDGLYVWAGQYKTVPTTQAICRSPTRAPRTPPPTSTNCSPISPPRTT